MATFSILSKNKETQEITVIAADIETWFGALNAMGEWLSKCYDTCKKVENTKTTSIPFYIRGARPSNTVTAFGTFTWDKKNKKPICTWNWIKKIA